MIFRKTAALLGKAFIIVLVTISFMEITLRVMPGSIPINMLVDFNPHMRTVIAEKQGLPTKGDYRYIPWDDGIPPGVWIFHPYSSFTYPYKDKDAVKTVKVDRNGFCNTENNDFELDRIDLITLGDSFAWCIAVHPGQTWPSQLKKITGRSVYNLARYEAGLYEHLQFLKWFALRKRPRMVILNIYEGNDLRDAFKYWVVREPLLNKSASNPDNSEIHRHSGLYAYLIDSSLLNHSYALNILLVTIDKILYEEDASNKNIQSSVTDRNMKSPSYAELSNYMKNAKVYKNFKYDLVFGDKRIHFNVGSRDKDETVFAHLLVNGKLKPDLFTAALNDFRDLSLQYGFIPLVVYTPTAYTAYKDHVLFESQTLKKTMSDFSKMQRQYFASKTKEIGLRYIDLSSYMQQSTKEHGAEDLLYFPFNRHLTPLGHRKIAERLNEVVEQELRN